MSRDVVALCECFAHDADVLGVVGAATFLEAFAGVLDGRSILEHCLANHTAAAYTAYLAKPTTRAWVAKVEPGGAPVGYALLTKPDFAAELIRPEDVELKRIYVFTRFHRRGVGRVLLEQVVAAAREAGRHRLLLGVHRDNARALSFYRRNEFEDIGTRSFSIGHSTYDDLVLARRL